MRELSLDQLRSFADVVELGSFSAAAGRRRLTQPAISLQVRQLERRLGVRLIERVGRRAVPTAAGRALLAHVGRIDGAVAEALAAVAQHAEATVGRVRLGSGATACTYLLPAMLAKLRRRFPELEIVVSTANTADILSALEGNLLDVALVTLPAPGRMFQVAPVLDDAFAAIFPAAEKAPARVTPALLADRPMVLYEPGANTRRSIDAWFREAGLAATPAMELGSVEAIKQLVAAGLGCAILPRMAVTGAGARPGLTVRPLAPKLSRQLAVVLRRDKPLGRALREVVAALQALKPPG